MAHNTKSGRIGQIKDRVQVKNPVTGKWVKINTKNGRIVDHKKTSGPYKGVRKKN
jgi:glutamate dehydrogenase/leucine dehydrogenase